MAADSNGAADPVVFHKALVFPGGGDHDVGAEPAGPKTPLRVQRRSRSSVAVVSRCTTAISKNVVEGILPVLIRASGMVRWLPEATANAVLHGASSTVTTLSAGAALAVLAGYAAALATGGAMVTTWREVGAITG
jgi:hypothetical protein